jgi:hypothetical protein
VSSFLNIRVADIQAIYDDWSARGAEFLTAPQDRGREIRCYLRDPDGHLIVEARPSRRAATRGSSAGTALTAGRDDRAAGEKRAAAARSSVR